MKVFIDAGAHAGSAMRKFMEEPRYDDGWVIHAFEPNPFIRTRERYPSKAIIHRSAAWVEDGWADFYYNAKKPTDDGASLIKEKRTGNLDVENPVSVQTIDFSRWLLDNFHESDTIVLKMDIEGAEYPVLRKMIKDGSIDIVDEIHLESHSRKVNVPEKDTEALLDELKKHTSVYPDYIKSHTKGKRWHEKHPI